jgi:hypothetical protein
MRIQCGGRVARNAQHLSVMRFADHQREAIHGSSVSEGLACLVPARRWWADALSLWPDSSGPRIEALSALSFPESLLPHVRFSR